MLISAIHPSVFYGNNETEKHACLSSNTSRNNIAISGGLALALLGTTAVTGIAHARIPHIISSALAIGTALFHVESLAMRNNGKTDYYA